MQKRIPIFVAAMFSVLVSLLLHEAVAEEPRPALRLAMMDMMPMGSGGAMQQPVPGATAMPGMPAAPGTQPAPAAGGMDGDRMRMGGGNMPAQGQPQAPAGQMPQPQAAGMCPMCAMMQNMPRMGAAQQGAMPPMPGGPAAGAGMGPGMPAPGPEALPAVDSVARLEGRIAYLRTALRITDPQAAGWDAFAAALRSGRDHLDAARNALQGASAAADPMARLESYEGHLVARMEAIRTTRLAFNALYSQLDEAQKRAATTTMLPFIGTF